MHSPSKINLTLQIGALHPNVNLHNLYSISAIIDLKDLIYIKDSEEGSIKFTGLYGSEVPNDNTVTKTMELLKLDKPYDIEIVKNIPIGSGLGGGSSNAATIICYFGKKYDIPFEDQCKIATQVGSDVMFFLTMEHSNASPKIGAMQHYGHEVTQLLGDGSLPCFGILVIPQETCRTKEVFKEFDTDPAVCDLAPFTNKVPMIKYIESHGNNMTEAILRHKPELKKIYNIVSGCGEYFSFTGSGSSLFVLYNSQQERADGRAELAKQVPSAHLENFLFL